MSTKSSAIDATTKVNIGILGTLLTSAVGGAFFFASMQGSVDAMSQRLTDVKIAIDRNTAQITSDGRTIGILQARIDSLMQRVNTLESKK